VEAQVVEQGSHHRAGHAVAAVDDDLQRPHLGGGDEAHRRGLELRGHLDLLDRARIGRRLPEAGLHERPELLDPRVP
jgi:hypothetical protein